MHKRQRYLIGYDENALTYYKKIHKGQKAKRRLTWFFTLYWEKPSMGRESEKE